MFRSRCSFFSSLCLSICLADFLWLCVCVFFLSNHYNFVFVLPLRERERKKSAPGMRFKNLWTVNKNENFDATDTNTYLDSNHTWPHKLFLFPKFHEMKEKNKDATSCDAVFVFVRKIFSCRSERGQVLFSVRRKWVIESLEIRCCCFFSLQREKVNFYWCVTISAYYSFQQAILSQFRE